MAAEEVHHGVLCAVIQEGWSDCQGLTEATLHNVPVRIIPQMCCSTFNLCPGRSAYERTGPRKTCPSRDFIPSIPGGWCLALVPVYAL